MRPSGYSGTWSGHMRVRKTLILAVQKLPSLSPPITTLHNRTDQLGTSPASTYGSVFANSSATSPHPLNSDSFSIRPGHPCRYTEDPAGKDPPLPNKQRLVDRVGQCPGHEQVARLERGFGMGDVAWPHGIPLLQHAVHVPAHAIEL